MCCIFDGTVRSNQHSTVKRDLFWGEENVKANVSKRICVETYMGKFGVNDIIQLARLIARLLRTVSRFTPCDLPDQILRADSRCASRTGH